PAAEDRAPAEPADLRPQITQLLGNMAAAVGAADQAGYLSHVSRTDPVFFQEQQNWAKDLGRVAPERIEIALDEAALKVEPDGSCTGVLTMNWRMQGKKDRSIEFPARFVRGE